ncbi:hypothetical protein SMACR_07335 [Sordaria macrospora]|uniref:WGS project CABT00000000 data, contig 2.45 n=2 Tax=Sordaria macrospora TaxID=5147 RepID=F7W8I1_SORMK|nr:uncharacterized protein SMAC_07335 [Sordaria macrospora k-hell]KAA8628500.1 hypothetical protein SMACR_07335 [Sordaria macrospora]KAH7631232.1 hypothetical protein B0T09DRAFT_339405 [Sordaria sp. MPI-SDFR-AT-0083]WPJ61677.1 hypothetical protein SMAC4_07335 [Sordaria macrospora]CCC05012.1 unnamed protein product [Sordaria macrospora k-hell]
MSFRLSRPAVRGLGSAIKSSRISSRSAALLMPSTSTSAFSTASPQRAALPGHLRLPDDYVPPTQPPSARPVDTRKSQLLRTYTSMLRSTPLMLIFQHNNLTAIEWAAIRRELSLALSKVPVPESAPDITSKIHLQVVRTRIFDVALKTVEFFDPSTVEPTMATTVAGTKVPATYNHDLSKHAWKAVKEATKNEEAIEKTVYGQLAPLLVGPVAILTLPSVSPAHLGAALSVLAPSPPAFPAPSRKKNPGYYDLTCQSGLQKLMLVGGRIEGKAFDYDGIKWVGGIENGLEGLRAQLVHMLQSAGMGLTSVLEGAGKSLWLTMESRRSVLEEEQNPKKEGEAAEEKKE